MNRKTKAARIADADTNATAKQQQQEGNVLLNHVWMELNRTDGGKAWSHNAVARDVHDELGNLACVQHVLTHERHALGSEVGGHLERQVKVNALKVGVDSTEDVANLNTWREGAITRIDTEDRSTASQFSNKTEAFNRGLDRLYACCAVVVPVRRLCLTAGYDSS